MGASTFITTAKGRTAREAFVAAKTEARYEHGHGGYTGTIAEKDRYVMITMPAGFTEGTREDKLIEDAYDYAEQLLDSDDKRISDKWGPAGCIKVDADTWLFFGWASE